MSQHQKDSKIYVEIVKQLRTMIERDGLKPGDRLPSERELSESLIVGRSSVREALRALELLGLIETRRGEGTFIRDFQGNNLVQLLSTFILQDKKARADIVETKNHLEMDCLLLAQKKSTDDQLLSLKSWADTSIFTDDEFFLKIAMLADNHLFLRIWTILKDYYNSLKSDKVETTKQEYMNVIKTLLSRQRVELTESYRNLRKMSNF